MPLTMHVDIVSVEEQIYSGIASMVFASAEEGDVGIMPRHAPMLTRLKPGEVRIQTPDGNEQLYVVFGGILEVQPNIVTILADSVVRAKDIDEAEAIKAQKEAQAAMEKAKSDVDYALAKAELVNALAQIKALERGRKR